MHGEEGLGGWVRSAYSTMAAQLATVGGGASGSDDEGGVGRGGRRDEGEKEMLTLGVVCTLRRSARWLRRSCRRLFPVKLNSRAPPYRRLFPLALALRPPSDPAPSRPTAGLRSLRRFFSRHPHPFFQANFLSSSPPGRCFGRPLQSQVVSSGGSTAKYQHDLYTAVKLCSTGSHLHNRPSTA